MILCWMGLSLGIVFRIFCTKSPLKPVIGVLRKVSGRVLTIICYCLVARDFFGH